MYPKMARMKAARCPQKTTPHTVTITENKNAVGLEFGDTKNKLFCKKKYKTIQICHRCNSDYGCNKVYIFF